MTLSSTELEQYKKKLTSEQARLTREMEENSKTEDFGSDIDNLEEETDESEAIANRLAVSQTLKVSLDEVEEALRRIADGTYGVCKECNGEISKEVLDTAPESALCLDCKKKEA